VQSIVPSTPKPAVSDLRLIKGLSRMPFLPVADRVKAHFRSLRDFAI
jgi:hypothetical protein